MPPSSRNVNEGRSDDVKNSAGVIMSNCQVFELSEIKANPRFVRDVVNGVVHTIVFNRALGTCRPREVEFDECGVTWVCVRVCENGDCSIGAVWVLFVVAVVGGGVVVAVVGGVVVVVIVGGAAAATGQ